ncbi:MAG: DUF1669 domain-containing protein [Candidatus Magasanikbacteria bacterium]|nr:DUF1669 domain-containing protein [Candidatus Magasanikbacteria bacterium]
MKKNISWEIKKNSKLIILLVVFFLVVSILLISLSLVIHGNNNENENFFYKAGQNISTNTNFTGKLYFNDQPNTNIFTDLITNRIREAENNIDLVQYSIDNDLIKKELDEAYENGVDISLILDVGKLSQHKHLFGTTTTYPIKNIGSGNLIKGDHMHHKFSIFDFGLEKQKLLFGSFNYTRLQENYDPSFVLETSDPYIISAFNNEQNLLENGIRGYDKLHHDNYKPLIKKINYKNGFVEVWFSPGFKKNSIKQRILELIDSAEKKIDIIIWQLTDYDIAEALAKKASQGVYIRLISDDYYIWSENSSIPKLADFDENNKNIEIISDLYRTWDPNGIIENNTEYFNPYIHQHTLIIDEKTVLSGTNNWSYNGFFKNDESILVSNVDFWINGFINSFNYHYNSLRNKKSLLNFDGQNIYLQGEDNFQTSTIYIFNENSLKNLKPEPCFKKTISINERKILIPKNCQEVHSLFLRLDKNNKIIESSYLFF